MTDSLVSVVRHLGPRDHLRWPELEQLHASIASTDDTLSWSMDDLRAALGDQVDRVTIACPKDDGSFVYEHFGSKLAENAGFDMTGKSTADFDTSTRNHIESSFQASINRNAPLTTMMPSVPGSDLVGWQRFVFPVEIRDGKAVVSLVIPLSDSKQIFHASPANISVGVTPLRAKENGNGYIIRTPERLKAYLKDSDISPIEDFVGAFRVPEDTPSVGTLLAATTTELSSPNGKVSVIMDIAFGETAPYLVVNDVTDHARTHTQLRSAEHLLRSSFELGKFGSWMHPSRDGDRMILDEQSAEMLGLAIDRDGFISKQDLRRLYDDELRPRLLSSVERCWEHGESYFIEGGITRPDGKHLQVQFSGSPMHDQAGRVIRIFGLVQDTTAEHATRRRLLESEERFRDFADSAADWCWETDAEHRFIDFTNSADASTGNLIQKYIGKTRRDFPVAEEDRAVIEEHFEDLDARREFKELVYRIYSDEFGRELTFQADGKPRFDANGTFLGYRGTGRNITDKVAADQERREHQLALTTAQDIAKIGYWITDVTTNGTRWSSGLLKLLGFDDVRSDPPGDGANNIPTWRSWLSRIHRNDRKVFLKAFRKARDAGEVDPVYVRYFLPEERQARHFRIKMQLKEATPSQGPQIMGVAQDVSDLKRFQVELEQRSETLSEAQVMGGIGNWLYDATSRTISWSQHLYTILGLEPEHFKPSPRSVLSLCGTDDLPAIRAELRRSLEGKASSSIDVQARRGDGTFGYYTMTTKPRYDERGTVNGLFGTIQDITERKRAEKQLRSLAYFDPLTGLANRALFSRELREIFRKVRTKGGSAALLLLDLDHFKEVNDTLGHAAGDELLRMVGRLLKEHVDERGFVSRLGGDEFAVIISDYSSVECLHRFAKTIIHKLTGILTLERGEVLTGTSLGIALIPQDGGDADEALRNADLALYTAKDEGRGRALFFKPELSHAVQARLNLARDLRLAIENGDLETKYQGQVDLKTGKVIGFEALARWKHPERGYISPAEFIPVAESSSLICDIGLWVLRDACEIGRAWLESGEPERVISVNVSAAQIWQSDFEDDVIAIIKDTGYPPHLLCLELTESVFADHGEGRIRKALARFKAAGIKLALDDFGTGYSSLGYLNDLRFDEMKIDRCFVAGIHEAPGKAQLLQGIIALGRGLGMRVVGEGAEHEGEIELLRQYGCDYVQGFAYMRPESPDAALRCAEQLEFRLAEGLPGLEPAGEPLKKTG